MNMNAQTTLTTFMRLEIMPLSLVCFQNVIPRQGRVQAILEPLTFPLTGGHKEDDNGLSGRFNSSGQTLHLKHQNRFPDADMEEGVSNSTHRNLFGLFDTASS